MFDLLVWIAFAYVALRILRRPEPRLWPWLGVIGAVGLETKGTVAALMLAGAGALLVVGPRGALRTRGPWLAAGIALAGLVPYLGWEAAHGWPTLTFLPTQDAVTAAATPRSAYVLQQLAFVGPALVLVAVGVRRLWRDPRLRALAVLAPVTSLLFFVEQGRAYYALPAIALPLAAGAVAAERWWSARRREGRSRRRAVMAGALVASQIAVTAVAAPLVWPVLPTATMVRLGLWQASWYKDELGWPELAAQTARAWRAIPAAQRAEPPCWRATTARPARSTSTARRSGCRRRSAATSRSSTGIRGACRSAGSWPWGTTRPICAACAALSRWWPGSATAGGSPTRSRDGRSRCARCALRSARCGRAGSRRTGSD